MDLWFLGGVGSVVLSSAFRSGPCARASSLWPGSRPSILSIAINGSRGLPQYFVQAQPALALAGRGGPGRWCGELGDATAWTGGSRSAAVALAHRRALASRHRTQAVRGSRGSSGFRNRCRMHAFDLRYSTGGVDRADYLDRFERDEAGKFSPAAVERLAAARPRGQPRTTSRSLCLGSRQAAST